MKKSGVVMQIDKGKAFIMTQGGEFIKVKITSSIPQIGELYTGEVAKGIPFYKYSAAVASILVMFLFGGTAYAYYTPTSILTIRINPAIMLKVNRWNRIIKSTPLNNDGKKILASINLNNSSLEKGLGNIVDEAKKENYINETYIESGKEITVTIDGKNNIDLTNFKQYVEKNNLKLEVIENNTGDNAVSPAQNTNNSNSDSSSGGQGKKVNGNNRNNNSSNNSSSTNSDGGSHSSSGNGNKDNNSSKDNKNKNHNGQNNNSASYDNSNINLQFSQNGKSNSLNNNSVEGSDKAHSNTSSQKYDSSEVKHVNKKGSDF